LFNTKIDHYIRNNVIVSYNIKDFAENIDKNSIDRYVKNMIFSHLENIIEHNIWWNNGLHIERSIRINMLNNKIQVDQILDKYKNLI